MKHLFFSCRLLCSLLLSMFLFLGATPMWGADYELVTSTSQLVAGCNYIMADGTSGSVNVVSTESNENNRRTTTGSVVSSKISATETMMVFTLGGSTNAWTFTTTNYAGTDGDLYNDDTRNNRLKVGNNTTTNKFTISFSNNEISSISCNGNTSRGVMCFNGTLVACYVSKSSTYKAPQLYKEVTGGGSDDSGDDVDDEPKPTDVTYVETNIANLTASDEIIMVWTNSSASYAITSGNGTNKAPSAVAVTIKDNQITTSETNIVWNIDYNNDGSFVVYPNGDNAKWLYCTNTNDGVRVGTNSSKSFEIKDNYLYHTGNSRYLGIYNTSDIRCYTSINSNITGQTLGFYKKTTGGAPDPEKTTPDLSFEESTYNATIGESFTAPMLSNPKNVKVKYSSSDKSVAGVDENDGTITLKSKGRTTIKASFEGDETYNANSASYELVVDVVLNKYIVTIETPENGTLIVKNGVDVLESGAEVEDGTTLNIEVDNNRGYSFRNWQAIDGSTHTYTSTFTYIVSAHVTIKANFDEIPNFTITLADDNTKLTPEYGGESIVLPSREDVNNYSFIGWSETNVAKETTTAPTVILAGEYWPTATMPLYPVYTRSEAGGSTDVSVSIVIADELPNGTASGDKVASFEIDEHVVASSTGGESTSSKIYGSPLSQWRFYRSDEGAMTISTTSGVLKSVTVTYSVDKNGVMLHGTDEIASGTAVENINAASITFTVGGGETGKTNGVIRVTDIAVVYVVAGSTTYYLSRPYDEISVTTAQYSTYFNADHAFTMPEGLEGIVVEAVSGSSLTLSPYYSKGNVVPAGEPLLLHATSTLSETTSFTLKYTTTDDKTLKENDMNLLSGTSTADEWTTGGDKYYRLSQHDGQVGFYWGAAEGAAFKPGANKAYLALPAGPSAPARFIFGQQGVPTDLLNVNDNNQSTKVLRDGRLYIVREGKTYDSLGRLVK